MNAPRVYNAPPVIFRAPAPGLVCPRCGAQDGDAHWNVHYMSTEGGYWARCPLASEVRA